jgi:eukaryotic-like serine/threonine-protein kinase
MALIPGARLGTYEIHSALGSGGMGEVYRATDTNLGRQVAIKVLPEAFAQDPERLARFEREAKTLAALNHPNIAQIYGLEKSSGVQALVMELVEGEDLSQRIARGPIPLDEALPIAKQIAEALEAAHEQGIIHRDLKPANIKVTSTGVVKVLDFGLAKLAETEIAGASAPNMSLSPTITSPALMTGVGVLLGTAAYMSPEQAKGRAADNRSDIWAFGVVLYEMLCGAVAFPGEDLGDVLAAVVRAEPDWGRLPASTPSSVRTLLRRCLRKDKTLRLQSAGDARIEVYDALSAPDAESHVTDRVRPGAGRRSAMVFAAGGLLLGGLIAGTGTWALRPSPAQSVSHLAIPLPEGQRLPPLNTPVIALSSDGSQVAFIGEGASGQQIYVRPFNSAEAKAVPGTEGAASLTFSPDGKWLAFSGAGNGGQLMKVSLSGGAPITICNAPNVEGVSWGDNDTVVFAATYGTRGLSKVSAGGGEPQTLTSMPKGGDAVEEAHRWPQVLPGGGAVLFTAWTRNLDNAQVIVQRLDSSERRVVLRGGTYARYVPTGHLVFVRGATLMAVRFDVARLEAVGEPVPLAEGVLLTSEGGAQFDVSNVGSLVHVPGGLQGSGRQLVWVDRSGHEEQVGAPSRAYFTPRISPDGRKIAAAVQGANDDVWTYDTSRRTLTRSTFEARSISPVWTPDGKRIVYRSARAGTLNLFARAVDGSGAEERLTTSESNQTPLSVSRDGRWLAFGTAELDVWVTPLSGDRTPRPFVRTPFAEGGGAFSPDDAWLAYHSNESGRNEVYVQPFPAGGAKVQISRDGGSFPRWTAGNELFFQNGTKIMFAKMVTKPALVAGEPEVALDGQGYVTTAGFDVSPDGKRLLMIKEAEQAASVTRIDVVLDWFDELARLVPPGR